MSRFISTINWHHVRRMFREARQKVVLDATYIDSKLAVATVIANCRHEFSPTFSIAFLNDLACIDRVGQFLGIPAAQFVEWAFLRKELVPTLRTFCIFDSPEDFILLVDDIYQQILRLQRQFPEDYNNVFFIDLHLKTAEKVLDELSLSQPPYLAALQSPEASAPSVR